VIAALAKRHRVIVPDAPGLGESAPVERLDIETFSGWFDQLLGLTCVDKPMVVAHSLFGSMAARYAARHGDNLRRLVIYGAPGIGPYRMPLRLRYVAIRFAIRPTAANNARFERFALLDRDATRARDPLWFDAFSEYARARAIVPHVKRAMWQLISVGSKQVSDDELRRIPVPVDLIWGRDDRMVPVSLAEGASTRLGWPLHIIPGAAHVPHMEQPEAFVRAISDVAPPIPTAIYTSDAIRDIPAAMRVAQ
jgi:2-hydroxymuconate-semialdehyde hydrolase